MATIAQLWVELNLRANDFNNQVRAAQREVKEFQKVISPTTKLLNDVGGAATSAGTALTVGLTAPIVGFGALAVKQFTEAADAAALLENAIKSTGGAAGRSAEQLKTMASELQKNTIFSDDEIIRKVQTQLLTFTNIAGTSFDRATKAALDMSTVLGQDLQSSSIQLGKALNDPIAGVTALQRVGVKLSESQKELVKSFMATGDIAKAQDVILKELTTEFGGAAEAAAKAGSGPFTVLKNKIEDLTESWGELIVKALLPFVNMASRVADWLNTLSTETKGTILVIAGIVAAIGPVLLVFGQFAKSISSILVFLPQLKVAFTAISAVLSGPVGIAAAAVAAAAGLIYLISKTEAGAAAINSVWETIKEVIANVWQDLQSTFDDIVDLFNDVVAEIKDIWAEWGGDIVSAITTVIKLWAAEVEFGLRELAALIRAALGIIGGVIDIAMGLITGNWDRAWKGLQKIATSAWNAIVDTVIAGSKYLERISRAVGATEMADKIKAVTDAIGGYRIETAAANKITEQAEQKANALGQALPEVKKHVVDLGNSSDKAAGQLKQLYESFNNSLKPADELGALVTKLQGQFSDYDIVQIYGDKIREAAQKQREHGYVVSENIKRFEELARQLKLANGEVFDLASALDHIKLPAETIYIKIRTDIDPETQAIINKVGVPQLPTLPRVGLPPVFGPVPTANTDMWDKWQKEGQKAIDRVVDDMSKMFIDGIVHGKSMWESFKNFGKNAVTGIVDTLMNKMLHSFLDPFSTAIGRMLDKLTSGLTDLLSGWGKTLADKLGDAAKQTATNKATEAATGAIPGGGGGGGADAGAAGGAGGAGSIVQMAVQAAGSIGVIFQLKRIEGTMNAVEHNTRYSMIHLGVMIDQLFWPWDGLFHFIAEVQNTHTTQLDAIYNVLNERLSTGGTAARVAYAAAAGPEMGMAGGTWNNIEINMPVTTSQDPVDFAKKVIMTVKSAYKTDRYGLRTDTAQVASQGRGISSSLAYQE